MDSNNIQVNTFSGGMNSDTSDALLSNNLYRYAENLRYITETDNNTGELHLIPGAKCILTIQEGEDPAIITYKILLTTELRDLGIFITEYGEGWAVWTYNNGTGPLTKVFYTTDSSRVRGADSLSLVTKYENQDNQKLYIADQKGPVLIILLAVNAGNVQETTDISDVSAYPSITFTKPQFLGLTSGQLKPGVVQYSYQYYNRYRQQSEISPATKLIPLIQWYNNSTKGFLASDNTNIGTIIKINVPASIHFERIRVFRIMYQQNGQLPTIEEIYDEKIDTGNDLIIHDTGQSALSTLTLEEYNSITGIHIIPKTIEAKDDYLFAGNIKDNSEAFDSLLNNIDFTSCPDANSTDDSTSYADYLDLSKPFKAPRYDGDGTKIGHQGSVINWYFVTTAIPFDYNSTGGVHNKLDYINRYCSYKNNNDALTFYVYDSKGYSNPNNALVFDNDVWNDNTYTNPVVLQEFKSLRRDEIYRYGIVLYNNKGESSSVKWIADIRTPDIKTLPTFGIYSDGWDSVLDIPSLTSASGKQVAYPLGIHFEVDTSSFPDEVVAYEIVRCKREFSDMATVSQGVISKTIRVKNDLLGNSTENPFTPTGYLLNTNFYCRGAGDANNRYTAETEATSPYLFVSPEADYTQDIFSMIPKNGLTLLPVSFIFPDIYNDLGNLNQNQYSPKRIKVGNDYAKMILGQAALLPQGTYESVEIVNERQTLIDPWPSDDNYYYAGNYGSHKYDVNRAAYIKLYKTSSIQSGVIEKQVNAVKLVEGLSYNDFADNSTNQHLKFKDKVTNIGQFNYVNWVVGGGWNLTYQEHVDAQSAYSNPHNNRFLMGPAGTCLVIDISGNTFPDVVQTYLNDPKITGSYLCNIRKSTIPYGGATEVSKKQSVYRSFGDLFNRAEQSVTIFDGDCYIMPFEHCTLHKWAYSEIGTYDKADLCVMYAFPVETNINLYATNGYEYSKEYGQHNQDTTFLLEQPSNVNDKLIQDTPQYVYNSVYSVTDSPRMFAADDTEYTELNQDYRVYNSLLKSSNEYIDSWLKFQPANYIDLDSRLGQITGLRRFKNQLIFWQDNATGILSVNERSLITDHDKMPLMLGSGDVLSRYDYITTSNGMKVDQYVDAQSESTLYWWDYVRKELCSYQSGQGYNILSKSKFVLNYINEHNNTTKPAMIFDKAYNELIANVVNDESLIYSELTGNFMSIYKIHPLYHIQFSDKLLLIEDDSADVYQWNVSEENISKGMSASDLTPLLQYVVNKGADTTKVFDNGEIAGRFYGGNDLSELSMEFKTPLKQHGSLAGEHITNREYNFRYAIPRHNGSSLGNRLRGKFMQAELSSSSNSLDFSLQYIMTKFRVSWS